MYILAGDVIKIYGMSVYHVINPKVYVTDQTGQYQSPCGALGCDHISCVLEAADWNMEKSCRPGNRVRAKREKKEMTEFIEKGTINGIPARQVQVALPFVCSEFFNFVLIVFLVVSFFSMVFLYPLLVFYYVAAAEAVIWIVRSAYYYKKGGLNPNRVKYW